jgi:MFS family permease
VKAGVHRALSAIGWWDAFAVRGPIRRLAVISLIDAMGTGLTLVCFPFYAAQVAGLGPGGIALTLTVMGLCELVAAVPNGVLAGRIGVRRAMSLTRLAQGLAYGVIATGESLPVLIAAGAAVGLSRAGGSGLFQSLTVAVVGERDRSSVLGIIRAVRNLGYLASSGLAGIVLALHSPFGLRAALICSALALLLGAYWISRLATATTARPPRRTNWAVLRDWEYLGLIAGAAAFGSSIVVLYVGLPLWVLRHQNIPNWTAAAVMAVNTALVVLLQFRFAKALGTVAKACGAIRLSSVAFLVMCVLIAFTEGTSLVVSALLMLAFAIAATLGEMLESPSWWTLSYELAPDERKNEYLAAFDLSWALVGILGPSIMAGVVSLGGLGWIAFGVALVIASLLATWLAGRRAGRMAGSAAISQTDGKGPESRRA